MAFALLDASAWVHSYDFTADSNQIELNIESNALPANTFGTTWAQFVPGVKSSSFSLAGFWSSGVDRNAFDDLGVLNRVFTIAPSDTEDEVAYLFRAGHIDYTLGGSFGDVMPFSLGAQGSDGYGVVRGKIAASKQTVDATGVVGSVVDLGAVGAAEYLYASFHVFGTPGTTVTVLLESDEDADFADPTTRATIGPLTTAGGVWVPRISGPISDTHYRLNVSAITGSFTVAGAVAVGN